MWWSTSRTFIPLTAATWTQVIEITLHACSCECLTMIIFPSSAAVRMHLQDYFTQSCQALGSQTVDLNLCLLCIQCFEVSWIRSIYIHSHAISHCCGNSTVSLLFVVGLCFVLMFLLSAAPVESVYNMCMKTLILHVGMISMGTIVTKGPGIWMTS